MSDTPDPLPTELAAQVPQPKSWRRAWLARLATSTDSPERTAGAFALGVFLSFSPLFGIQIGIGIGCAMLFRLSRMAVLVGLCTNMPWIMVPWYAVATAVGAAALGVPLEGSVASHIGQIFDRPVYRAAFWAQAFELLRPFLWSFVLGTLVGAALLAVISYIAALRFIQRVRTAHAE